MEKENFAHQLVSKAMDREEALLTEVRAIIFDFDGLLVDTETCMYKVWETLLAPYNVDVSPLQVAGLVGCSAPATFLHQKYRNVTGIDISNEKITSLVLSKAYELVEKLDAREGVREYLAYAKRSGWKIALATSSESAHYLPILKRLELHTLFDHFIGAEDIVLARRKPEPDVYLKAVEKLGVESSQVIAFEDSPPGITAAKAAKITTVAVPNFLTRHLDVSHAHRVLHSMAEISLPQLITELTERRQ